MHPADDPNHMYFVKTAEIASHFRSCQTNALLTQLYRMWYNIVRNICLKWNFHEEPNCEKRKL